MDTIGEFIITNDKLVLAIAFLLSGLAFIMAAYLIIRDIQIHKRDMHEMRNACARYQRRRPAQSDGPK